MEVTFCGHQSWIAERSNQKILFDPLLKPYFGASTHSFCAIRPYREISNLHGVVAVFLSHEHADHFCVETLSELNQDVTIYTGHLMPHNVDACIARLGKTLEKFGDGQVIEFSCGIRVTPRHGGPETPFWERRVYQFEVDSPDGCFFLAVDAAMSPTVQMALNTGSIRPPALFAASNNSQVTGLARRGAMTNASLSPTRDALRVGPVGLDIYKGLLSDYLNGANVGHIAVCGGGFVKGMADIEAQPMSDFSLVIEALDPHGTGGVSAPEPGDVYLIEEGCARPASAKAAFVTALQQSTFTDKYLHHTATSIANPTSLARPLFLPCVKTMANPSAGELTRLLDAAVQMLRFFPQSEYRKSFVVRCCMTGIAPTVAITIHVGEAFCQARFNARTGELRLKRACSASDRDGRMEAVAEIEIHQQDFVALSAGDIDIWELSGSHIQVSFPDGWPNHIMPFLYSYFSEQVDQELAMRFVEAKLSMVTA